MKIKLIIIGNGKGFPILINAREAQGSIMAHKCADSCLRSCLYEENW